MGEFGGMMGGLPASPKAWKESPLVYRNDRALPRAFATYSAQRAPDPEALLPRLASPSFDPLRSSYVEGEPIGPGGARRGHALTIERDEPTRIEIQAEMAADGLVVLADSFYPGWVARVDGEPAAIEVANFLFRGVRVPAGLHRVELSYEPSWLAPGWGASLAGCTVLGALGVAEVRRRRRERA